MSSKPDLGVWIASVGVVSVLAAIIAGLASVGGPADARAQRLDAARLMAMQEIATAAQCAYTFTNKTPASVEEIRTAILEQRTITAVDSCNNIRFTPSNNNSVSYEADGEEHIRLCAEFRRPSPQESGVGASYSHHPLAEFPELQERRTAPGRHCFRVRLVRQVATASAPAPPGIERAN